ncbi:MAG: NAD(P)/FAD-dependent oxidoreductase [Verrucomicrobia bacterium]|nr:NAD(P)/FAD-dependent oxidoreductase [Verrucomicrobiota bacterium]MBS0636120.1 NAD(P)/FAD-dependent oxidoreductase [Verrucomicrobiota bacterium]
MKTLIIGAGFGGLEVAKDLKKVDTDVVVIDKLNHHLFQPLLYQVATCALSPGDIATPVRSILCKSKNTSFIMGTVERIDKVNQKVHLACGMVFDFDYLVLAPGTRHSYFGHDEWEELAPGLKTIQDATYIREKILMAFEQAERAPNHTEATKFLRFAIVGAGPTGVELAGSIAEIAFMGLKKEFTKIRPDQAKIFLIEGAPCVLPGFPEALSERAKKDLEKLGVTVMTNSKVSGITEEGVIVNGELLIAPTVLWAAGNIASPLLKTLDVPLDRQGRVLVEQDLSIPGHPNIFVIGDAANLTTPTGPLPGLAPVAKQEGYYVAKIIRKKIPKEERKPFKYFDKGSLATIGKGKAVGMMGKLKMTGFFAWFVWSAVHILYLIDFKSRIKVFFHWSYLFLTGNRAVMLITRPLENHQDEIIE